MEPQKDTVLFVLSKDIIRRNIYATPFWGMVTAQTPGVTKLLVVDEADKDAIEKELGGEDIVVEGYTRVPWSWWGKAVMFLVRTGIDSHSTRLYRMRAYRRGEAGMLATFVKECIARVCAHIPGYQSLIRRLVMTIPLHQRVNEIYEKHQPALAFIPSLIDNDFDVPFAVAARRRGIRVVGMVRSWDNLNNHGVLAFVPDRFLLQNEWLAEAAEKFQGIDMKKLPHEVVGLPHYDLYATPEKMTAPREEFFRTIGLDTEKKLILVGGSDFYYSEDVLPRTINALIEKGEIQEPVQVVFRPHPASPFKYEEYGIDALPHVHLDAAFQGGKKFNDTEKFINLMYHADVIVNIASTLSIDAAVFDRPAVCINFDDPVKNLSYWEEVHRLYDSFDHYEKLVATGGVRLPDSPAAFAREINAYLADPSRDAEGRRRIVRTFVGQFDGRAAERIGTIIVEEIQCACRMATEEKKGAA